MVQAFMGEQEYLKTRVYNFEEMHDDGSRQGSSMVETNMSSMSLDDRVRINGLDAIMSPMGGDEEAPDPSRQAGEFRCRFIS